MNKKELRKIIRNRKRQYSSSHLEELSLSVLSHLEENGHLQSAHTVMMYYSLPDEVNTHQFIDELVNQGKQVFLPVVVDGENMEIREYTGSKDLRQGSFHIMEPVGRLLPVDEYGKIEAGIIPGMSFDKSGHRLGRGKGYYDRMLCKMPHLYKIGICFDFQKTETVPTEATDIKMDAIV